ncbi:MAG: DUF89 family protein [Candidatus Marinimicrobia bacterium]|nr:DUF89 family protein [Candidatus Neomarinimicrobiota bacterium]
MKTYLDCLPCMLNQALRTARIVTNDEVKIKKVLDEVGTIIKDIPMHHTPVQSGALVYQKIRDITGVADPYKDIKKNSIKEAQALYPTLIKLINKSDNKLHTAIRIAIAGNIIDFGMNEQFNLEEELKKIMKQDFAIFDFEAFINELEQANSVLYIGDNAGESVLDKILIKTLGKPVTYVVRGIPIINDVTIEDAIESGISEIAEIISSGSPAPGTILELCDKYFVHRFNEADMVISKGQGNYEGLSNVSRSVFFLLKAKCKIIANDLGVNENDIILKGINQ